MANKGRVKPGPPRDGRLKENKNRAPQSPTPLSMTSATVKPVPIPQKIIPKKGP